MKFIRKNWRFRESEQNWTTEDLCTFFAVIRFNGDRWRCFCCWVKWKPQNHLDIQNRKNHRTPTFFLRRNTFGEKNPYERYAWGFFFSRFCTVFPHQHSIRTYASREVNAFNELMQMHPIQSSHSQITVIICVVCRFCCINDSNPIRLLMKWKSLHSNWNAGIRFWLHYSHTKQKSIRILFLLVQSRIFIRRTQDNWKLTNAFDGVLWVIF